jgi:hypothetical protein
LAKEERIDRRDKRSICSIRYVVLDDVLLDDAVLDRTDGSGSAVLDDGVFIMETDSSS